MKKYQKVRKIKYGLSISKQLREMSNKPWKVIWKHKRMLHKTQTKRQRMQQPKRPLNMISNNMKHGANIKENQNKKLKINTWSWQEIYSKNIKLKNISKIFDWSDFICFFNHSLTINRNAYYSSDFLKNNFSLKKRKMSK